MLPCRGTLLDVGCGSCQVTTYLAPEFEQVYALDFSESMLAAARQRVESSGVTNIKLLPGTAVQVELSGLSCRLNVQYRLPDNVSPEWPTANTMLTALYPCMSMVDDVCVVVTVAGFNTCVASTLW